MTSPSQTVPNPKDRRDSVQFERILQKRVGDELSQCRVTLRTPTFEDRAWRAEIECEELFGTRSKKVYGEDAFQSIILSLRLIKTMIVLEKSNGIQLFWLEEGDECGMDGIQEIDESK